MSEHRVNPDLIHRTAWGNPLWNALQNLNIYGMCLAGSLVVSFIWPLALPACLLFTLITVLIFSLQRWRCPLRMPMTLRCADPSQDRMIKRSLFEFWPTLFQYETIKEFPANGIFYVGYQRIRDIGRELWLNIDDLTRHVMFLPLQAAVKQKLSFHGSSTLFVGEEALRSLTVRLKMIQQEQSGICPDVLAVKMMLRSSTS